MGLEGFDVVFMMLDKKLKRALIVSAYIRTSFFHRFLLFLVMFLATSGLLGFWIIKTPLLYTFDFYIYGNMGKVFILGVVAFLFLVKDRLEFFGKFKFNRVEKLALVLTIPLIVLFYFLSKELLLYTNPRSNLSLYLFLHFLLVFIPLVHFVSLFGKKFCVELWLSFKEELLRSLGFSILLYFGIFQAWKLWPYFSAVVLQVVYWLLGLSFGGVYTFEPLILGVGSFSIVVGQACSGTDSLFLFTALYWFFGIVDWKKFNRLKLALMFIPAALGLFVVNILRIYLLMVIGVLLSPTLALGLFHTYAGLVMFLFYFVVFWRVFYGWLLR